MASCKDCIHEKLCVIKAFPDAFENTQWGKKPCDHFKPKTEWISVEERLPEVAGREYLVWDDIQATVKKRFFYRIPPSIPLETYPYIREYFGNSADYKRYTHWMPLPEPPKESKR